MDYLQFAASALASLAWPVTAFLIASLFRRPITRLLDRLKKAKGPGGVDMDFGELAAEAQIQTEQLRKETAELPESVSLDPQISKLLLTLPAVAFTREFKALESLMLELRERVPEEDRGRTLPSLLRYLAREKMISRRAQDLFQTLRDAFNALKFNEDAEFEPGEFEQLVRSSRALYEVIEQVLESFPSKKSPH
jgi:hypothetical protein